MIDEAELDRRKAKAREWWKRRESWLEEYKSCRSVTARVAWFRWREGVYVLSVAPFLLALNFIGTIWEDFMLITGIVSLYVLRDAILVNTAIVFGKRERLNPLRSVVLTMWAYLNIAVSFVPGWILLGSGGSPTERVTTAVYQSLRTLSTVGPEGNPQLCAFGKLLATAELFVGVYFLVIILAMYASLATNAGKEDRT